MALELHRTGPGEWRLKRNNVEVGKIQCTRHSVLFALIDRKHPLSKAEKEELDELVRCLLRSPGTPFAGDLRLLDAPPLEWRSIQSEPASIPASSTRTI